MGEARRAARSAAVDAAREAKRLGIHGQQASGGGSVGGYYKSVGTDMLEFTVGKRCPVPINDGGMLAWLMPTESGVDVMLIARSDQLRANELAAARTAEIGVYATARMLWLILWGGSTISWDAPHHPGYAPEATQQLREAAKITVERNASQAAHVVIVDQGVIVVQRSVAISAAGVRRIGETILALPEVISRQSYDASMAYDQQLTTAAMMRAAV